MNNSESAKKGFRTFILTLAVSLMVFSAVYYVLTTYTQKQDSSQSASAAGAAIQQETAMAQEQAVAGEEENENVQGAKDERGGTMATVAAVPEEKTVFGQIAQADPHDVLAGATSAPQTPQTTSSVPTTGFSEMTIGLIVSLVLFVGAMIYTVKNPRKVALAKFEKGALMKTEKQK